MPPDALLSGAADLLAADLLAAPQRPWRAKARPKQLPPDGDWHIWLLLAGRGFGKNFVGSNWLAEQAIAFPGTHWAVIGPTFRDVRTTCIEGTTGLLAPPHRW
jgi:phage terminase large subunit-like protein